MCPGPWSPVATEIADRRAPDPLASREIATDFRGPIPKTRINRHVHFEDHRGRLVGLTWRATA